MSVGSAGQGVRTTPATCRPRSAGGLERQQRVVDRPEARASGDHEREREVDRELAYVVAVSERDQQSADPLDDRDLVR